MRKSTRIVSLILCLVMCISLFAGCGGQAETPQAPAAPENPAPDQGNMGTPGAPVAPPPADVKYADHMNIILDNVKIAVVNPLNPSSTGSALNWVEGVVYEALLYNLGQGQYKENLATAWETEDYKTFKFTLRDDVYFHNGEKFTSADVVYSVNAYKEATGTKGCDVYGNVASITAIDDYTVEMVLNEVNVDFLSNCSNINAPMLNEKAINADPEKGPWVGTGAYRITNFVTNDTVEVERFEDYWGEPGITKTMKFMFIPEESTRLLMLQNGEVDICFGANIRDLPVLEADPDTYTMFKFVSNGITMMGFNMDDPLTGDINFRKAVASAINKPEIVAVARGAYGEPVNEGTFWGPGTEFMNESLEMIPEDLEKAQEYLAASPYNGEVVEIAAGMSTTIKCAEVIQQQLSRIGIKCEINQMDMGSISAYLREGKHQIYCNYNSFTASAASARTAFYPGASYNYANYVNDEVIQLLDSAQTMTDIDARRDAYYRVQECVAEDIPVVGLLYFVQAIGALKGVEGVVLSADNYHDLRYMYRIID